MAGCSNEEDPVTPIDDTKVELGITAGVALTKSAIDGGEQKDATGGNLMGALAVYAKDKEATTSYSTNNYALYTRNNETWSATVVSGETPKIFLTSDVATIYAYHPAYTPDATNHNMQTTGDPLKMTGTLGTDAKIDVSVFEGGTSPANQKTNSTITVPADYNATAGKILSAPGEVDYMWAEKTSNTDKFEASNGKTGGTTSSVALNMKHALSMVSFRVYNDGNYAKTGLLSKIELKNESNTVLSKGTSPTMDIASGSITAGVEAAATYTRIIANHDNSNGYTLPKQGVAPNAGTDAAKDAAAVFSILVLPDASAVAKNKIQVTFTIDGESFVVTLATDGTSLQWERGKNYLYTAKLSGKSLTLSSVTVEAWNKVDKDLGTVD